MKVSKFSEQQIALILKQVDDGLGVDDACRKAGVSQQMVADLSLDKAMLQDVLSKTIRPAKARSLAALAMDRRRESRALDRKAQRAATG